jgi:CRISPR/Cas system CSM-associated protein Csm3 (group 7 of RAMP superfamily)
MTHSKPFFYIARLVLKTCTPLSIASGRTDGIADNLIVRDANGLPAIPGSSLAGVLRHSYQRICDPDKKEKDAINTNALFGSDKQAPQRTGEPSYVHVSWGCLHDKTDNPIEGLLDPNDLCWEDDEIIKDALQSTPIKREHVKLNHRGVSDAKQQGKFDRASLTTGHRFSVELSLWSDEKNDPRWEQLLDLIKRPDFRLGGGTRRGLGKLKIIRCYTGKFNLQETEDFNKFGKLTQCLTDRESLEKLGESESQEQLPTIKLNLTPLDGYRFGGGTEHLIQNGQADMLAVTENCVTWKNSQGAITEKKQIVIPASSVKGAISHRVAYHYNVLTQAFADQKFNNPDTAPADVKKYVGENNEAVKALFGYVNEDTEKAQIGSLIFDDIYLARTTEDKQVTEYTHNSMDRFTGGVRDGALFSEEVITDNQPLVLNITVVKKPESKIWHALELALNDLTEGRLALGAGGGRGHGYFSGEWKKM